MSYPKTVLEAFKFHLPQLKLSPNTPSYRQIHTTTVKKDNESVPYYRPESPESLVTLSTQRFNDEDGQNLDTIKKAPFPALDTTHQLRVEADVARAASIYLIHPVNIALAAFLPKGASVHCNSEVPAKGSRFDIQWELALGNKTIKMAILEIKNTNTLRSKDFRNAACAIGKEKEFSNKALLAKNYTLLEDNAIILSQQAIQYAQHSDDVAVFDWHSMVIFNFSVFSEQRDGRPVDVAYYAAGNQNPAILNFRLILLGFLLRALDRHVEIDTQHPNDPKAHLPKKCDADDLDVEEITVATADISFEDSFQDEGEPPRRPLSEVSSGSTDIL